jgi:hypothetical protein
MYQNINAINLIAERQRREKERERQAVAARINEKNRRRHEAAELANTQARVEAQKKLREEVKRDFMMNPWATEADFNEAWKRDKLTMIREYEQSRRVMPRM